MKIEGSNTMKMLASFSGGKDSMLSLDRAIEQGYEIEGLFVTVDADGSSWFHDINNDVLEAVDSVTVTLAYISPSSSLRGHPSAGCPLNCISLGSENSK